MQNAAKNIILTGFMGTGKTTVGKLLAQKLHRDFVDTDHLIETRQGITIPEIFAAQGEAAFRQMEADIAKELGKREGLVISTGGRLMLDPANVAALAANGRIFCLVATPEEILSRLDRDEENRRPLLDVPDPHEQIIRLLQERTKKYQRFLQITTDGKDPQDVAGIILNMCNESINMQCPEVTTKLVILLGNPLGHSLSPVMHNHVFKKLGLDYCYMPVEVTSENLETVFKGLTKMNVAGFNVTIPHKVQIMEYLDEVDSLAATIGAVNTISIKERKTKGYNTDGEGFIRSLEEEARITVAEKRVFLIGSGGAARAIAMTLVFKKAEKIYIFNRTRKKAEALATEINDRIRPCVQVVSTSYEEQQETIKKCDILVNCTSLGMTPQENELPIEASLLTPDLIVADIVYNPLTTKLLKTAEKAGCRIVHGLGMLIYQGAAAFTIFTGREPLIEEMSKAAYALITKRR